MDAIRSLFEGDGRLSENHERKKRQKRIGKSGWVIAGKKNLVAIVNDSLTGRQDNSQTGEGLSSAVSQAASSSSCGATTFGETESQREGETWSRDRIR